jgi:uncharacterized membrane protein YdbT with pleckstrin-like domain
MEKLIYISHPSRIAFIKYYLIFSVFIFASIYIYFLISDFESFLLAIIGFFILLMGEIKRLRIKYLVTNERVIKNTSFINKKSTSIPLHMIERITVSQNILEKLFSVGNINIDTGEDEIIYKNISKPYKVEKIIRRALDNKWSRVKTQEYESLNH